MGGIVKCTAPCMVKQAILDLKRHYAIPVYDRSNIHKTDDEELV